MHTLNWELSILSRAVAYKNLSAAAVNVGVSQPQLSRIVAKIEAELGVIVLDRGSRRKSGWTPVAFQLAELYSRAMKRFERDLVRVSGTGLPTHLRIGTLEGLMPLALQLARSLFDGGLARQVEVDVHDLNRLEELFSKGEYDLLFISREPVGKKLRYSVVLGYQQLDRESTSQDTLVLSSFESQTQSRQREEKRHKRVLISNSLAARKLWIEEHGGAGVIPSKVLKSRPAQEAQVDPVILMGSELLPAPMWEKIKKGIR